MRPTSPDRMDVIKKEEKESRLVSFIANDLEARKLAQVSAGVSEYLLVLRSAESPVARALLKLSADIASAGVSIRVVLVQNAAETIDRDITGAGRFASALRVTRDVRLLDAHEQLVLGPASSWIGDCMRRDPLKRDAFELYAEGRTETARWATVSFERLWTSAEPIVAAATVVPAAAPEAEHLAHDIVPLPDDKPTAEIATRH